jgi:hypothetical protein
MKKKLLIPLLCLAFILPVCIAVAQETEVEEAAQSEKAAEADKTEGEAVPEKAVPEKAAPEKAAPEKAAPAKNRGGDTSVKKQTTQVKNTAVGWFNKAIAFISQIGAVFGNALGFRIGGTTGTAIASIAVAKLAEDRIPSWLKWLLYLFGGTMVAGSGGNIAQMIMSSF